MKWISVIIYCSNGRSRVFFLFLLAVGENSKRIIIIKKGELYKERNETKAENLKYHKTDINSYIYSMYEVDL